MKEIQDYPADLEENQMENTNGNKSKSGKVKTRRAKRKHHLPYHKFSESEIKRKEEREEQRKLSLLERMKAKEENVSPYNEAKLMIKTNVTDQYFYQEEQDWSKENQEDFICKEFQKDYEIQQLDRLEKMSKEMLMNEYLSLESKTDYLERKLTSIQRHKKDTRKTCDPYLAESIIFFKKELEVLKEENQKLTYENTLLSSRLQSVTSTCHEDYYDKLLRQDSRSDDTGYESSLC